MATLTEFRSQVRTTTQVIVIALVIFLGYKIVTKIFRRPPAPPPPIPPNYLFGKLPAPKPSALKLAYVDNVTYSLDLYAPTLPKSPLLLAVYKYVPITSSLFGPDRAKKIAKNYGFTNDPAQSSDNMLYTWTDQSLPRTFQVNLFTREFNLNYDWKKNPDFLIAGSIKSVSQAENMAIGMVQQGGLYPPALANGTRKVSLLKVVGGELRQIDNDAEASVAKVDFYAENINDLPVVYDGHSNGSVSVLLSNSTVSDKQVLSLSYRYWTYDFAPITAATYPIKTSEQAWGEVKAGKGIPVFFHLTDLDPNVTATPPAIREVRVKEVSLAYFDSTVQQDFIQPIYVFECEARLEGGRISDYYLYVPAIANEWLVQEADAATTDTNSAPSQ